MLDFTTEAAALRSVIELARLEMNTSREKGALMSAEEALDIAAARVLEGKQEVGAVRSLKWHYAGRAAADLRDNNTREGVGEVREYALGVLAGEIGLG